MSDPQTVIPDYRQRIRAGEIYTTADIVAALQVSKKTVGFWYRIGLEFTATSPHPKAKRFVMGDVLIEFLRCYGFALRILARMGEEEEDTEESDE